MIRYKTGFDPLVNYRDGENGFPRIDIPYPFKANHDETNSLKAIFLILVYLKGEAYKLNGNLFAQAQ